MTIDAVPGLCRSFKFRKMLATSGASGIRPVKILSHPQSNAGVGTLTLRIPGFAAASFLLVIFSSVQSHAQWVQSNVPANTSVQSLAVNDTNLFAGTDGGVYFSSDNGMSWVNIGLTDRSVLSLAIRPDSTGGKNLFAGANAYGVSLSTNNGKSWTYVNSGMYSSYVLSLAALDTNLLAGTTDGVFVTTNNGSSWISTGLRDIFVDAFAVSGPFLYAGTYGSRTFLSTDNGSSWTADSVGLTDPFVRALMVSPDGTGGTNLFAGTDGGIFRSSNNGASWSKTAFTKSYVYSLAFAGTKIFAGTYYNGAFLSTDNGASWTVVNTGLANITVRALAVSGTYLIAGTDAGVWRRPLSELVVSVLQTNKGDVPGKFVLEQNYPNPFNTSTTITFGLPGSSHVRLTVYDVLGREVSVLVNETREAGVHEVRFDCSNLASGVYLYRIEAERFVQTKGLLLCK